MHAQGDLVAGIGLDAVEQLGRAAPVGGEAGQVARRLAQGGDEPAVALPVLRRPDGDPAGESG